MMDANAISAMLDVLCPMHVWLDPTGHIRSVGPTLRKLRPDDALHGQRFLELFELGRPRSITSMYQLMQRSGARLHLRFRSGPRTGLKGVVVPLPSGLGAIVNLSFGISVIDAVRDYNLNSADFAVTDLTIEMLYLVEAKSIAMEASRRLNLRLQGAMIAAEEQAYTDTLTGLKNRRAMDFVLQRLVNDGSRFSLLHLDLDFFKEINDTLGHSAGDHVLRHVARVMTEESRDTDCAARVGGDEFVLIFNRLIDRGRLDSLAARLIERIQQPIPYNGQSCKVSASVGIVVASRESEQDADTLMQQADLALYSAKNAGRGTHRFYRPDMRLENRDLFPHDPPPERRTGSD
ncbi:MAG: GGDEF domain-containing protein [Pseudooceanicola sp.]|nr:GGDEF domain-containing protein [Pseudooceanicola sp.]